MYPDNSNNMTQPYDRKAKGEKRKAKNEKHTNFWKTKSKKQKAN